MHHWAEQLKYCNTVDIAIKICSLSRTHAHTDTHTPAAN